MCVEDLLSADLLRNGLGSSRQLTITQVVLHHDAPDGYAVGGSEASVLDIDADCNFGVFERREADEGGVVFAKAVFGGAGLTAYVDFAWSKVCPTAGAR